MALAGHVDRLSTVLSSSKTSSAGGSDSQAVQLEILHEIARLMAVVPPEEVSAVQSELEKSLLAALLQGPASTVRRLMSRCFVLAYSRGTRTSMYTTMGLLISWLSSTKGSPASTVLAKMSITHVLGSLCETHGMNMVSLCSDTITLLTKGIRSQEVPMRQASCHALSLALVGSGGIAAPVQAEIVKSLKHVIGERGTPADARISFLKCQVSIVRAAEGLWAGDILDQLAAIATKHLDDPSAAVRTAAAETLGLMLAAALEKSFSRKGAAAKPQGKLGGKLRAALEKKSETTTAMESVLQLLTVPFTRSSATRELRHGIAQTFVHFLQAIKRPDLERNNEAILGQVLSMVPAQASSRHPYDCVTHILRAGLGERLSERSQLLSAGLLAGHATARHSSDALTEIALKECAMLLLLLREVAISARDSLLQGERPLLQLIEHPTREVRLSALQCLWALMQAFPTHLAGLMNTSINRVRIEHANLAHAPDSKSKDGANSLIAHALAVGTLVTATPHTPFGVPQALFTSTLNAASDLASTGEEVTGKAAWILLSSLLALEPEWMASKHRLTKVYAMWKAALAGKVDSLSKEKREEAEVELRSRAEALGCLTSFLRTMPEACSSPLLKPVVSSLLPPNTALLALCREGIAAVRSQSCLSAFLLFRARLYGLLDALPSSALSAKLLNVVMPMNVADIVEPSNTLPPSCSPLLPLLSPEDAPLCVEERLRSGVAPEAEASCEWFSELHGDGEASAEAQTLTSAVSLFAAVFRLQTSDVRSQLLHHLATAAAKVAAREQREARERSSSCSALTNICAALLGSLGQMHRKPSKSSLDPKLADELLAVLTPCLQCADAAVRRGAAQSVGLLGELLREGGFGAKFFAIAKAALADPKSKDDAKSGYALALGWLARSQNNSGALRQVVATLTEAASGTSSLVTEWCIHALGTLALATATDFKLPAAIACITTTSSLLVSDPPPSQPAALAIARLATALLAVLLPPPEAQMRKPDVDKLAGVIRLCACLSSAAVNLYSDGPSRSESLHFARACLDFPPALRPYGGGDNEGPSALRMAVLGVLPSAGPELRVAALACQRELCAREAAGAGDPLPSAAQSKQLVQLLFDVMEHEAQPEILDDTKRLLLQLLHSGADTSASYWLSMLRSVVVEVKKTSGGGGGGGDKYESRGDGEEGEGEEEEGQTQNNAGLPSGDSTEESEDARRRQKELEVEAEEASKWAHISPRWQTRLFAVECVGRMLSSATSSEHFDLTLARQSSNCAGQLVSLLQDLISVCFTAATAPVEALRPAGVLTLLELVHKFGTAMDPDFDGHLMLEQYHAQIAAAARPCFAQEAEPSLQAAGFALLSRYLLAISHPRNAEVDPVAVRKLLALVLQPVQAGAGLHMILYPAYSESAATMVRAAALHAAAQLQTAAAQAPGSELAKQLQPSLVTLRDSWMALLRDQAALATQPKVARRAYRPHLYAAATATGSRSYLLHAWPSVLEATVALVATPVWAEAREAAVAASDGGGEAPMPDAEGSTALRKIESRPALEDLHLLFGLCMHTLAAPANELSLLCAGALRSLLLPDQYLHPAVLPLPSLLNLLALLSTISGAPATPPAMHAALAPIAPHLASNLACYSAVAAPADLEALLASLQRLAAAPMLRALPALHFTLLAAAKGVRPPTEVAPRPLAEAEVAPLVSAMEALALIPALARDGAPRLALLPTALLLTLHALQLGATAQPPRPALVAAAATTIKGLLQRYASLGASDPPTWASLLASANQTLEAFVKTTPPAQASPHLVLMLRVASADPSGAATERACGVVCELLAAPAAPQKLLALRALQANLTEVLQEGGGTPGAGGEPMARLLCVLAPSAGALLLRSERAAAGVEVRTAALRVVLLFISLATTEALSVMLALALPLFIDTMHVSADGAQSAEESPLSQMAQASVMALAKRSPEEFRTAAAGFSVETKTRMATAIQEATVTQRAAVVSSQTQVAAAAPKIALKMDFSSFGKK